MSGHPFAPAAAPRPRGLAALPGLRTLGSRRFRLLLAGVLLTLGLVVLGMAMLRQARDPAGQFAIDFDAYHGAAVDLLDGRSPYDADMLAGPFDAQGAGRYLYPPPLGQALAPLALVDAGTASVLWLVAQAAAALAATLLALRIGGSAGAGRRGLDAEAVLWCAVATTFFLPVFDTLWKGNVSGFLALLVALCALGGRATGASAAIAGMLKVAPATLLPAALASGRRAAVTAGLVIAGVLGLSVLLAPAAWHDYAAVLPNLLAGRADQATNVAPWATLERSLGSGALVTAVRSLSIGLALAAVMASIVAGRRPRGLPAAAALGAIAMLLLPAALWYHYLAVLLPVAALAWPTATTGARSTLVGGGVLVALGVAWLPAALVGAIVVSTTAVLVLWPRSIRLGTISGAA